MKQFPTELMQQYQHWFDALMADMQEAGRFTRVTPRADRVAEIARQTRVSPDKRDGGGE